MKPVNARAWPLSKSVFDSLYFVRSDILLLMAID